MTAPADGTATPFRRLADAVASHLHILGDALESHQTILRIEEIAASRAALSSELFETRRLDQQERKALEVAAGLERLEAITEIPESASADVEPARDEAPARPRSVA